MRVEYLCKQAIGFSLQVPFRKQTPVAFGIPAILNDVGKTGIGNGGDIELLAPTIEFTRSAELLVSSRGLGNAGNILVQASKSILLDGKNDRGIATSFASDVEKTGVGNGGNIIIQTPLFQASRGAFISVDSVGKGGAGNLNLKADRIILSDSANLQANANDGTQGNITIQSQSLSLRNQSHITAIATGKASGGNITINSDLITGLENSDIIANAIEGKGGNIKITTQGIFGLQYRDRLTPENDITASSEFGISGNVQVNTIGINPANALNALPGEIHDSSRQIADRCGNAKTSSFIATGRGGMPQGPKKHGSDRTWNDLRTDAVQASSSVPPIAQNISQPIVEATAFQSIPQVQLHSLPQTQSQLKQRRPVEWRVRSGHSKSSSYFGNSL
jgi:large exoprotein involved in heme utilization and adhesion